MLSANLKLPRKEVKRRIGWFNDHVWWIGGKPLEIKLGLTTKFVDTTHGLKISLAGSVGRRVKTFLEAVYDRHGRWAANQPLREYHSNECWLQGDRPQKGRSFTFVVPCPARLVSGDFICHLRYTSLGWIVTEIGGYRHSEIIDWLARGLDLRGYRLPNHWYYNLYLLIK